MVGLLQAKMLRVQRGGGGGAGDPNFFLRISFSLVKMSFHVKFHLPRLPGKVLLSNLVAWLFYWQAKRLRVQAWGGGGVRGPNFFLQISFSWVKMSFHVEFHLPRLPGSALKVFGGWWWWVVLNTTLVFSFGPNLWFRLWIWPWTKLNKNNLQKKLFIFLH